MRRPLVTMSVLACSLPLAACAGTTSTAGFKGTEHEVAQTIANLQSDVTASEQKKVCANDLAAAVVSRLGGAKGCEAVVKERLSEIDNTELTVESVKVSGTSATASVKSVYSGRKKLTTVSLVKEGGKWRISTLQ
jgi:hypothetical protein